jgi:hypothetical protein
MMMMMMQSPLPSCSYVNWLPAKPKYCLSAVTEAFTVLHVIITCGNTMMTICDLP